MLKRDYIVNNVSRIRHRRSSSKAVGVSRTPQTLFCWAIVLLLIFGVIVFRIIWQPASPLQRRERPLLVDRLPSKPAERWRYIKLLEDKKSPIRPPLGRASSSTASSLFLEKAPIGHRPTPSPHTPLPVVAVSIPRLLADRHQQVVKFPSVPAGWVVQCGPFHGIEQAQTLRASLALRGIESAIRQGNGWQRVVVGPYPTRTSMSHLLKELRRSDLPNCVAIAS